MGELLAFGAYYNVQGRTLALLTLYALAVGGVLALVRSVFARPFVVRSLLLALGVRGLLKCSGGSRRQKETREHVLYSLVFVNALASEIMQIVSGVTAGRLV